MTQLSAPPPALSAIDDRGQLLATLAEHVPALIAYYDKATLACVFSNRAYARYNGWTVDTILGKTVREVIGENAWNMIGEYADKVLNGEPVGYAREQTMPDGEKRFIDVSLVPHFNPPGTQIGAFVLISDITERHRAERALAESEERLAKFVEATREGIYFYQDGIITDLNQAMTRLLGYSKDEMIGRNAGDFVAEDCRQKAIDYLRSGGEASYEATALHKSGRRIPVEFSGRTLHRNGVAYRMGAILDISERKKAEEHIRYLAHHDALTGLPNRVTLMERLESLLALARRRKNLLAVLFLDLDAFKPINDQFGHHVGDLLLAEVARRIEGVVREADVVARHGGDEFLIVLADLAGVDAAAAVAAKLLASVAEPFMLEGHNIQVALSIGVSLFPRDGATPAELIRHADAAMYLAKSRGRAQVQFFTPAVPSQAPATRARGEEPRP